VRSLLVAATGGHLAQLVRLRARLGRLGEDVLWVTFDTSQSRALLAGEDVRYVAFTAPRDWRNIVRNAKVAHDVLRDESFGAVVSTGAGIALSFMPLARARGIECHYIESAARSLAPSVTGRILRYVPGVHVYTQYPAWARRPWRYAGSVFDGFEVERIQEPAQVRRILVTLGTIPYPFPRLVHRLEEIVPDDVELLWQTGATDVNGLRGGASRTMLAKDLHEALHGVDVVVAHAGTGSALDAIEAGMCPILVPRQHAFAEHVDDHQRQVAEELDRRGLALHRRVDDLTPSDLVTAASRKIHQLHAPPPLRLEGSGKR
jgi:UDP-N-acetylglucosamine--N-acetylmuramyl-(pentapeptide) pyrophosphoryl-undecaprenol N-acetylglucosamine transferase